MVTSERNNVLEYEMKLLLVQIGAYGDCLLTTIFARQIKEVDFPGCHLTWLVGDKYKNILENNPYIDRVVTVQLETANLTAFVSARENTLQYVGELSRLGEQFDYIIDLNISLSIIQQGLWGTLRSAYERIYSFQTSFRVIVPMQPIVCLTRLEIENVKSFMEKQLGPRTNTFVIVFEYAPSSKQSNFNKEKALFIAYGLVKRYDNVFCIMSSDKPLETNHFRVIDANTLSYRENAELLNQCDLFVGSNSGITWLNQSSWSKNVNMIVDVVDFDANHPAISYSIAFDKKIYHESTHNLIEFFNASVEDIYKCIATIIDESFEVAKSIYPLPQFDVKKTMIKCKSMSQKM